MNNNQHPATSPDRPIYFGSPSSALGQQLLDIRNAAVLSRTPAANAARSRLEKTQNRNREILEAQARRENRAAGTPGLTVGVPSDGGFSLQAETAADLSAAGFANSEVVSRCDVRVLNPDVQFSNIVAVDEKGRINGLRHGGVAVYTTLDLDELTQSKPTLRLNTIEPAKLTGLFFASDEMLLDALFLGQEMRKVFSEAYAFKCQDQVINGSGAGEALGVVNANATIKVSKESGQGAATILTKNLSKMWAVFHGETKNAVWLINRNVASALDELIVLAGTGGTTPGIVSYAPGGMYIKGVPVVEIEQCETLGTVGDIILADFSQYTTANKGDVNEAMSIHVHFIDGQNAFRFIYYFDGQPRFAEPITPYKGASGAKVSPFVVLETRS